MNEQSAAPRISDRLAGPLPWLLALIGCALFAVNLPPLPDHGYQFYLAQKLLDGARLFIDVGAGEPHPPLFTWTAAASISVARLLGLSGFTFYLAMVAIAAAAALYVVWKQGIRSSFVLTMLVVLLFPYGSTGFGQGEHIALILTLPYLVATAAGERGPTRPYQRILIALACAFGLSMKPYFALVWLFVELYRAWLHGWRSLLRAESITILTFFILYVAATALFTPAFFTNLPWILKLYPHFAALSFSDLFFDRRLLVLIAGLVAGRFARRERTNTALVDVLSLTAVAMYAAVLLQGKGWGYHWYPVLVLSFLLIAIAVDSFVKRAWLLAPVLAVASIVWMNRQVDETSRLLVAPPGFLPQMMDVTEKFARGRAIVAFSHVLNVGFPLVNFTGVEWASPYGHLWMVPAMYSAAWQSGGFHYRQTGEWQSVEQQMFDRSWSAVEKGRPALVFMHVPLINGFDMDAYIRTDARFRALLQSARYLGTVGYYRVYQPQYAERAALTR